MDTLMKSERKIFLSEEEDNKANGYYGRTLNTGSFKVDLNVPRDRKGKFRPKALLQVCHALSKMLFYRYSVRSISHISLVALFVI